MRALSNSLRTEEEKATLPVNAATMDSRHPHRRHDAVRLAGALRFSFVSGRVKACLATSREFAGVTLKGRLKLHERDRAGARARNEDGNG